MGVFFTDPATAALGQAGGGGGGSSPSAPEASLFFTGASSQYLSLTDANWGSYDRSKFSIVFSFFNAGGTTFPVFIGKGNSSTTGEWNVQLLTSTGALEANFHDGIAHRTSSATISGYAPNTWYAVKIDYDGSIGTATDRVSIAVNGVDLSVTGNASTPTAVPTRTAAVTIGARANPDAYFDGFIHQPTFFSGVIPDNADVFDGTDGKLKDLSGLTGAFSLLDASTATYDVIKAIDWTNNNGVQVSMFNPSFVMADISDMVINYDASDTASITESANAVSSVSNQVSGGNPAYQTLAANKPTTNTVTINGLNALSFDGGDALLIDDFSYSVTGQTIFIVADINLTTEQWLLAHYDTTGNQRAWGVFASNSSNLLVHAVSPDGTSANLRNVTTTNTIGTNPKLLTTRWEANDTDLYLDGGAETPSGTPAASMLSATPKLTVGARYVSSALATFLTGYIGQVIMYDRALTTDEIRAGNAFMRSKWGV